jgi:hypothetical protein
MLQRRPAAPISPLSAAAPLRRTAGALALFDSAWRSDNPGWRVVPACVLHDDGAHYRIDFALLHRDHGIALIALAADDYTVPDLAIRLARGMLDRLGFARLFIGYLPIVFVAIDGQDRDAAAARIVAAFGEVPGIGVANPNWAEWTARAFASVAAPPDEPPASAAPDMAPPTGAGDQAAGFVLRPAAIGAACLCATVACAILLTMLLSRPGSTDSADRQFLAVVIGQAIESAQAAPQRDSRLLSEPRVAAYLGLDLAAFREKRDLLQASGFPAPEAITGNYDRAGIDRWLDRVSARASSDSSPRLRR